MFYVCNLFTNPPRTYSQTEPRILTEISEIHTPTSLLPEQIQQTLPTWKEP
jgi:hypothetical protein